MCEHCYKYLYAGLPTRAPARTPARPPPRTPAGPPPRTRPRGGGELRAIAGWNLLADRLLLTPKRLGSLFAWWWGCGCASWRLRLRRRLPRHAAQMACSPRTHAHMQARVRLSSRREVGSPERLRAGTSWSIGFGSPQGGSYGCLYGGVAVAVAAPGRGCVGVSCGTRPKWHAAQYKDGPWIANGTLCGCYLRIWPTLIGCDVQCRYDVQSWLSHHTGTHACVCTYRSISIFRRGWRHL